MAEPGSARPPHAGHQAVPPVKTAICVAYSLIEHFTNQLIQSIAEKSTRIPREVSESGRADRRYQFIAGKEARGVFHTFNVLFDMHKQIVLSSDRSPEEMRGIEERLISPLQWGLVTDIQPPDLETRVAILQRKAQEENLSIPDDVMRYIATHHHEYQELEGAHHRARLQPPDRGISIAMVEEVLRDLIGSENQAGDH